MRTAFRAIGTVAIAATVVSAALVAVNPRTARACICGPPTGDADDVAVAFVGRPVAEDYADVGTRVITEFEVDWIYKGSIGPRVEVHSTRTDCGIFFGEYEDWRDEDKYRTRSISIAAWESAEGELWHGVCRPWKSIGSFEEAFGPRYPPEGSIDEEADQIGEEAGQIRVLASTLLLSVAAILAIWLLVARRRARQSSPPT